MKRFIYSLLFLIVFAIVPVLSQGTPSDHGQAGDKAVLGSFNGLSKLSIGNYGGGFGSEIYVAKSMALRTSVGFTFNTGSSSNKAYDLSGGLLFDIFGKSNTNLYVGPEVHYSHTDATADSYMFDGVVGVEVYNVLAPNTSLSFEYVVGVLNDPSTNVTTWTFGKTYPSLNLAVWL